MRTPLLIVLVANLVLALINVVVAYRGRSLPINWFAAGFCLGIAVSLVVSG